MSVIHQARELEAGDRKVCLAIGMFDGVHRGHQRVLNNTVQSAKSLGAVAVAVTFDCHPNAVVAPERTPPLIYSLAQRIGTIECLGIETVLLIHFDHWFSRQTGEEFVTALARDFGQVENISIGRDFTFGKGRGGNVALLKKLGVSLGFAVQDAAAVSWHEQVISSTRIREAIQQGDFDSATDMLGRPYSLAARILAGEQLGRTLGFPTANLDVSGLVLPPTGVYVGWASEGGRRHRAVANLGYRPTLKQPEPELRFEVHLLNFNGNLYGQDLEFTFVRQLRGEKKFPSLEALKSQIAEDVAAARAERE